MWSQKVVLSRGGGSRFDSSIRQHQDTNKRIQLVERPKEERSRIAKSVSISERETSSANNLLCTGVDVGARAIYVDDDGSMYTMLLDCQFARWMQMLMVHRFSGCRAAATSLGV